MVPSLPCLSGSHPVSKSFSSPLIITHAQAPAFLSSLSPTARSQ